MGVKLGLSY